MIEYIIIGLLGLVIILLIVLICKKNKQDNSEMIERIGHFEANINKEIGEFKFSFAKTLGNDFEVKLNETIKTCNFLKKIYFYLNKN